MLANHPHTPPFHRAIEPLVAALALDQPVDYIGQKTTLNSDGCAPANAPAGALKYTDGAHVSSAFFANAFPYLRAPLEGSPNDDNAIRRAAGH